jgi:hypothetical protein
MAIRTPKDDRIRQLEDELFVARQAVFHLIDPQAREILTSPFDLDTRADVHDWFKNAVEEVLKLADAMIDQDTEEERAICPLCHESAQNYRLPDQGFAFPEGLRRHLRGSHKGTQCRVSLVALNEAIDSIARLDRLR